MLMATSGSSASVIGTGTVAINDVVSLIVRGAITYTVDVSFSVTFTSNLEIIVRATNPINSTDPNPR